ncbi:DNA-directed RNA polymerase subunit K [archaeon SCG-AAA382B04]|nr:DNA-directed RNA polymerase subunit K [archaeon SCG-AAA382B04]
MNYNKFERARIIGARALQISLGAPTLIDANEEMLPIEIAQKELEKEVIPITVRRKQEQKHHFFGELS